jgi:hypothetical protein
MLFKHYLQEIKVTTSTKEIKIILFRDVILYSALYICHLSEERFGSIFMVEDTLPGGGSRYLKKLRVSMKLFGAT